MKNPEELPYRPRILISGESAGTGASTTSKLLAEHLSKPDSPFPTISGGPVRRGISNRFRLFQNEHLGMSTDTQYQQFLTIYEKAYQERGLAGAIELLKTGIEEGAKGDVLGYFLDYLKERYEKTKEYDKVWDYITDERTLVNALKSPGFVWESKLAILALKIDQLKKITQFEPTLSHPYMGVLLKLDPAVAAQRIGQRENRVVSIDEVLKRKSEDFDRFNRLYTIGNKPVEHSDLAEHAELQVNTEFNTPSEVSVQILIAYLDKLHSLSQEKHVLAVPAMNDLYQALVAIRGKQFVMNKPDQSPLSKSGD